MFRLVELVEPSKRRHCEDERYRRNNVHWKKGGACGSPTFFPSYGQLPRWSVLGRVMFMDTLHDVI
jgi:hypothetical protein